MKLTFNETIIQSYVYELKAEDIAEVLKETGAEDISKVSAEDVYEVLRIDGVVYENYEVHSHPEGAYDFKIV